VGDDDSSDAAPDVNACALIVVHTIVRDEDSCQRNGSVQNEPHTAAAVRQDFVVVNLARVALHENAGTIHTGALNLCSIPDDAIVMDCVAGVVRADIDALPPVAADDVMAEF
jgi:hypothetical protein